MPSRNATRATSRHQATRPGPARLAVICLLALSSPIAHACLETASKRYGIPPGLLQAIAAVESGLRPGAVNRSHWHRTASYDIGLMQVNSSHLKKLRQFGIQEAHLHDACTNLMVGAWILADLFARHGTSWDAVGAYNASCRTLSRQACLTTRSRYAWKVYRQLHSAERTVASMAGSLP